MFDIRKIQEQVICEAVKAQSNEETARNIVYGGGAEDNPTWVKNTMKRLTDSFDPATVKKIRMNCQCGYGMAEKLELLKELMAGASNLDEFANNPKAKAAGLSYQNNNLYLKFPFCPCPMLAEVDRLDDLTWCQCTTGYSKVLFEKAFGCEVEVELLKSVKAGDDCCLMEIVPKQSVRF
ncbi:MAG: hypothetical protein GX474_08960 [Bacteroidales bacterium]|mgnify:FL=1|jgi:predicted hydrocarbon binding protein|nr:hypothetical protein [Bacteroidales bacterium]